MGRRLGLLAAALVIALLGTSAVFAYVSRVEARAVTGQESVDVLVAAGRIAEGTLVSAAVQQKLIRIQAMPRRTVPEGALTTLADVTAQAAVSDIYTGEVLLAAKFADRTARTGDLVIPDDKIAISVQLGDPQRVAGFVVPGSEVAIFNTLESTSAKVSGRATQTSSGTTKSATVNVEAAVDDEMTRLLLPRVTVIAVGPATLRPPADTGEKKEGVKPVAVAVLTVAVTQADAERLVHAAQTGDLYFGLLSAKSKTGPSKGVSNSTLFK